MPSYVDWRNQPRKHVIREMLKEIILKRPRLGWTSFKRDLEFAYRKKTKDMRTHGSCLDRLRRELVFEEFVILLPRAEWVKSYKAERQYNMYVRRFREKNKRKHRKNA